jgi:hypothetical protein
MAGEAKGISQLEDKNFTFKQNVVVQKVFRTSTISALTTGATVTLDSTLGNVFTLTPDQSLTINATTVGAAGQEIKVILTSSGTTSRTITFGTNMKSTGTLATGTTTAKVFCVTFISDGTTYVEVARTGAQ